MTLLTKVLLKTGSQKEKENIVWNMAGSFCYAFASMVLSFLVMRVIGEEEGGIFSFGFSTFGQQMFLLAYFGIRSYQVTDMKGEYSFGDYFHHRVLTCTGAVAAGFLYLAARVLFLPEGYSVYKAVVIFLLVCYKVIDGFADVYESEFQRNGNLHLTGKSNTFRTILTVGVFLISLVAGHNLLLSCVLAVAAQALGLLLFNIQVINALDGVNRTWERSHIGGIFKSTVLLFVSVFLDFYIFSAAKYAIDAHMNDTASGHFNIIFMPTSIINLAAGFVIRPFLTYLTEYWNRGQYQEFERMLKRLCLMIGGLSVLAIGGTCLLGKPVLAILEVVLGNDYTGRLTGYDLPFILIVTGGAFYALLNLFYYVLVILRKQKMIFCLYLGLTVLAAVLSPILVKQAGIMGAAVSYLVLMVIMAVVFVVGGLKTYYFEKRMER